MNVKYIETAKQIEDSVVNMLDFDALLESNVFDSLISNVSENEPKSYDNVDDTYNYLLKLYYTNYHTRLIEMGTRLCNWSEVYMNHEGVSRLVLYSYLKSVIEVQKNMDKICEKEV